jgi:hypothetical protein
LSVQRYSPRSARGGAARGCDLAAVALTNRGAARERAALFAACRLQARPRRAAAVFRGARELHLSPKAFELLKVLVESRPRAISRPSCSPRVSRRHAHFIVEGGAVCGEDLGSKNGTFVSGRRIAGRVTLEPGAQIRIGPFTFVFRVEVAPASTETEVAALLPRVGR